MNYNFPELHSYSFAATGLGRRNKLRYFGTRTEAEHYMYKMCRKYSLNINEVWDDHHDKTYKCNRGVSFYIQRAN